MSFQFDGPVYLSLDLDVLDPAFAPGINHYEPGGFSTRQLLQLIQSLETNLVGADIVELNPERDVHNITATVAAKLIKELLAKMLHLRIIHFAEMKKTRLRFLQILVFATLQRIFAQNQVDFALSK